MSDGNNYGGERRLPANVYNCENFVTPDNYSECDIHLYNRLVQTTNSLLYDGSYSVCSTPDSFTDAGNKHLSLQNLCDYSSGVKTEDTNLSCEDCNIMEELLPYPTHLSLYEVKQKSLSNSIIKVRNTHRYDEFLTLHTDEQTDVESCEKHSESEFIEDDGNASNEKEKNICCEEIDNSTDPFSETLHLVPINKVSNSSEDFPMPISVSDAGASCFSANDCRQSYEVTSEGTSYGSSRYDGSYSSKNMTRYEIMKRRKFARDQRKSHNSMESGANREPSNQKSIEQLVSFIEGTDVIADDKNGCGDDPLSRKNNRSLSRGKRHAKKKKKDRSFNSLETVSNSTTSEPTSLFPSEQFASSKSSSLDNASLPCHSLEAEEFEVASNDNECKLILEDQTSIRWGDTMAPDDIGQMNDPSEYIEQRHPDFFCGQQLNKSASNNCGIPQKVKQNSIKDIITIWSEASRCDVVDGFPEITSGVINDNSLSIINLNQCNNNDFVKMNRKSKPICKLQSNNLMDRFTEDDDKLTEFSYSSNANSSGDDLSSKESELEEFVTVQKKKKIKVHERASRPLQTKMFMEKKKLCDKPEMISKHCSMHLQNGISSNGKDSDCLTANLPVGSAQWEAHMLPNKFEHLFALNEGSTSDEHLKSANQLTLLTDHYGEAKSLSRVFDDETVFFDTRYLHKLEKPISVGLSDISFIFEEHPNTEIPEELTEEYRTEQNLETISEVPTTCYYGETNDHMAIDVSLGCSSEDNLNVSEKDKSSQCTTSEIMNCSVQPNMIMLPEQAYPCPDDLILPVPYLPFPGPPFNTYPIGFASSPECHADQSQIISEDSEQLLGNSSFPAQSPLPMISPMYGAYNCYLAVIPSVNHEAPFLANHPDLGYCELTCNPTDDELSQNYSDFPYHRRLNAEVLSPSSEENHLIRDLSIERNPTVLPSDHIQTIDNAFSNVHKFPTDKFHASSSTLSSKENLSQVFTSSNRESRHMNLENPNNVRDSFRDDHSSSRMPFQTSHLQNIKRGFNRNNLNWVDKRNSWHYQHNPDFHQERMERGRVQRNEFFRHGDSNRSSMSKGCCSNQRSNGSCGSCKKLPSPKSSFNLESAQLYLFDLFKASSAEENRCIYLAE